MSQVPQFRVVRSPGRVIAPKIRAALSLLVEAYEYARDVKCDAWDFAVEIETLRAVGLTPNDFRWLVSKGYVEPGCEKPRACGRYRELSHCGGYAFNKRICKRRACFILTDAGLAFASECSAFSGRADPPAEDDRHVLSPRQGLHWDADLRELSADGRLIKRYRTRAANQEAVLTAFEEEGWPRHIDDPLTRTDRNQHPKRRLNDTVKALNRHQITDDLIHFAADGRGEGVRWTWVDGRLPDDRA